MNGIKTKKIGRHLTLRHALIIVCSFALFTGKGASLAYEVTPGTLTGIAENISATDSQVVLTGCAAPADFDALRRIAMTDGIELDLGHLDITGGKLPDGIFSETNLSALTWPAAVASLPTGALSHSGISKLNLPASVREIGEYALSGCDRLSALTGGEGVVLIGEGAFADCIALRSLPAVTNVDRVGSRAFAGSGVESLSFPRATKLLPYALSSASHLTEVTLGRGVHLGRGAMAGCISLRSVAGLPAELPDLLFALSPAVETPRPDTGVTAIGSYAFAGNNAGRLSLRKELREISRGTFADMNNLKDVSVLALEGDIPQTDDDAFEGIDCSEVTLHVDRRFTNLWSEHPVWGRFMIQEEESGMESVTALPGDISVSCSGGWLCIEGDGTERDVEVYDTAGTLLFRGTCTDTLRVNLSGSSAKILIVTMSGKNAAKVFLR